MNHVDKLVLQELQRGERRFEFTVNVKRYYTDVDGTILDKNTVAATYKRKFPVFMLGEFDRRGGYRIANSICPVLNGLTYLTSFVNGFGAGTFTVLGFTGLDQLKDQLLAGDLVTVYTDSTLTPTLYVWIVQQNVYAAHASVVENLATSQQDHRLSPILIDSVDYYAQDDNGAPVVSQFDETWFVSRTDNIGNTNENQIQPRIYLTPEVVQVSFVRVPIELKLSQYLGLNFYMNFSSDQLTLNFNFKSNIKN